VVDGEGQRHPEQLRRVLEPLQVVRQPEDGGAVRRLVSPDSLEYARAVVEPVGTDMDPRVVPRDQLAVHPDLLGLTHSQPPLTRCYWVSATSSACARDSRISSVGVSAAM